MLHEAKDREPWPWSFAYWKRCAILGLVGGDADILGGGEAVVGDAHAVGDETARGGGQLGPDRADWTGGLRIAVHIDSKDAARRHGIRCRGGVPTGPEVDGVYRNAG